MAKNITVIPATQCIHTGAPLQAPPQKRVAGYARVSTGSEEQLTSYEAQVDYYTNYIRSRPDWLFVDVEETKEKYAIPSAFSKYAKYLNLVLGKEAITNMSI